MKRPSWSWRSSTSFTSKLVFLFVAVCQPPTSVPRPGRHGRTLLANWRQRGHVNSPLSTEKPWRTWSFWRKKKTEVNVDLYNFKLFKFQYLSFKIWLYSGLDYSYIYICHNFGFIYFVGLPFKWLSGRSAVLLPSVTPCRTCGNLYAKCVHRSGHRHLHPNLLTQTAGKNSVEIKTQNRVRRGRVRVTSTMAFTHFTHRFWVCGACELMDM